MESATGSSGGLGGLGGGGDDGGAEEGQLTPGGEHDDHDDRRVLDSTDADAQEDEEGGPRRSHHTTAQTNSSSSSSAHGGSNGAASGLPAQKKQRVTEDGGSKVTAQSHGGGHTHPAGAIGASSASSSSSASHSHSHSHSSHSPDSIEVRLLVDSSHAGAVIGKGGSNISRLRTTSGAGATILKNENFPHAPERILQLRGNLDSLSAALRILLEIVAAEIKPQQLATPLEGSADQGGPDSTSLIMLVHRIGVGAVIGSGGSVIQATQAATGARIHVSTDCIGSSTDKQVAISGTEKAVHAAAVKVITQVASSPLNPGTKIVPYVPGSGGGGGGGGSSQHAPFGGSSVPGLVGGYPPPPPMPMPSPMTMGLHPGASGPYGMMPLPPMPMPPMPPGTMMPAQAQQGQGQGQGAGPQAGQHPQHAHQHQHPHAHAHQPMQPAGYPAPYGAGSEYGHPGAAGGWGGMPGGTAPSVGGPGGPHSHAHAGHHGGAMDPAAAAAAAAGGYTPYPPHFNPYHPGASDWRGPGVGGGGSRDRLLDPHVSTQKIAIPAVCSGVVIGHGGSIVRELVKKSGAKISLERLDPLTPSERVVSIVGNEQQIAAAIWLIQQQVESYTPGKPPPPPTTAAGAAAGATGGY